MKVESRKSLQFKYNIYRLSLVSFTTVIFWIGFEIYRSYNKPKPTKVIQKQIEALNPNLDLEAINMLEDKIHIDVADLAKLEENLVFTAEETPDPKAKKPAPTITPSLQSSQSAELDLVPIEPEDQAATESGNTN